MSDGQLTRRQVLCAGAVTAVGAMTLRSASASADGDGLQLSVQIPHAPNASSHVYEVALGAFQAAGGRSSASRGSPGQTSEWTDTTIAFRVPFADANNEIQDWVAAVRQGRRDERDVVVTAVLPQGRAMRYELERCSPVAFARLGFENGVGRIEVLTLAVGNVTSRG